MYKELKELFDSFKCNIYQLDECIIPIELIASKRDEINRTSHGLIIGRILSMLNDQLILSLCKLYDKPSNNYPTVSIFSIPEYLNSNGGDFDEQELIDRSVVFFSNKKSLEIIEDSFVKSIYSLYNKEIDDRSEILENFKYRRDKIIAHNELIDPYEYKEIYWIQAMELKGLTDEFRECIDYSIFNNSGSGYISDLSSVKESMKTLLETILEE